MTKQELLDYYSKMKNLLKREYNRHLENNIIPEYSTLMKTMLKDFASMSEYQIDLIDEIVDIFSPLLVDLNVDYLDSDVKKEIKRLLFKFFKTAPTIKLDSQAVHQNIVQSLYQSELFEDYIKTHVKHVASKFLAILQYEPIILTKERVEAELVKNILAGIKDFLNVQVPCRSFLKSDQAKTFPLFLCSGINLYVNKDILFEVISSEIERKKFKTKKGALYEITGLDEQVAKTLLSTFDYEKFIENIYRINKQVKDKLPYDGDFEFKELESYWTNHIELELSEGVSLLHKSIGSYFKLNIHLFNIIVAKAYATAVSTDIFDSLKVSFSHETFVENVSSSLKKELHSVISETQINEIIRFLLMKNFFAKYQDIKSNLLKKMKLLGTETQRVLILPNSNLAISHNCYDGAVLKAHLTQLQASFMKENFTLRRKMDVVNIDLMKYKYGQFKRACLDFKNYINSILLRNLSQNNISQEEREVLLEFVEEVKDIFSLIDSTFILQKINMNNLEGALGNGYKIDNQEELKSLCDTIKEGNRLYIIKRVQSQNLKQSSNLELAELATDFCACKHADCESGYLGKITEPMQHYYDQMRTLELCCKLARLLANPLEKLTTALEPLVIDAKVDLKELLLFKEIAVTVKDLLDAVSLTVFLNMKDNNQIVDQITSIHILTNKYLSLIGKLTRSNLNIKQVIERTYHPIRCINSALKVLLSCLANPCLSKSAKKYITKEPTESTAAFEKKYEKYYSK